MPGHLDSIFIAPSAKARPIPVPDVRALAGQGLEGDRYALGVGSFSRWPGGGRAVSLIEAEALDAIHHETGIDLREGRSRRNLVTRGVRLTQLVGRTFRIGTAVFRGDRPCQPCKFLERLTAPGAFAALNGRGGLRADVIETGVVRPGDEIVPLPPASSRGGRPLREATRGEGATNGAEFTP
jgi:MOSC domain-containing protein YiiM